MNLTAQQMLKALTRLSEKLTHPVRLIIGGGGALLLAHDFPLATQDIDAVPAAGTTIEELDPLIKQVATELEIPFDWLNPYYGTFTHVLPNDYGTRLETILSLNHLHAQALSKDDILIMKCFAGRLKDRVHSRALIQSGANLGFVEKHIESLRAKNIPGADKALDFLDEVQDE